MEEIVSNSTKHFENLCLLADLGRGACSPLEICCCQSVIAIFSKERLFNNHVPDFSVAKRNADIYRSIWEGIHYSWERFKLACGEGRVNSTIDEFQNSSISNSEITSIINTCLERSQSLGQEICVQPKEITELGAKLLDYQSGTIYNPFAGGASYGLKLKAGDDYFGEEINNCVWAIGTIKLLLSNNLSRNYQLNDSTQRLGIRLEDHVKETFDYIISTPPFGYRCSPFTHTVEELLLSRAETMLKPNGKMVLFVSANIASKGGRIKDIRKRLIENNLVELVISLPKEAFQPSTSISTLAIVLRNNRENTHVKFLDARSCLKTKKTIDVDEILRRLEDNNHYINVSQDAIKIQDYNWHPGKYEIDSSEQIIPGYKRIKLREVLVQTGSSSNDTGSLHCISLSDLSSNPFDFNRNSNDFPQKVFGEELENAKLLEDAYKKQLHELTQKKDKISVSIARLEKELKAEREFSTHASNDIRENSDANERELSFQIKKIDEKIWELQKEIARGNLTASGTMSRSLFTIAEELRACENQKELIAKQLVDAREAFLKESANLDSKLFSERKALDEQLLSFQKELHQVNAEIRNVTQSLNNTQESLRNNQTRKLIKVVHPSIILGGNTPKIKFVFVDANNDSPVYITSSHCYAFKVDNSIVDSDFLAYQISQTEFKDYGSVIPLISREEILNTSIQIPSLIEQRSLYAEKEDLAFPYRVEIRELRNDIRNRDEVLASKHHELGHYRYRLFNCAGLIYDFINSLPEDTPELEEARRLLGVIDENLIDMQDAIDNLEERELFPIGTPIDIYQFLEDYCSEHAGGTNYSLTLSADKLMFSQEHNCLINIDPYALHRVIHHIRTNAEKHGFADDNSRTDYEMIIKVVLDTKTDCCIIDFINNGVPIADGVTEEVYADPSGVAEPHPGTGKGGAEVARAAKTYGGTFFINPADADHNLTTIRLIFPLYHE